MKIVVQCNLLVSVYLSFFFTEAEIGIGPYSYCWEQKDHIESNFIEIMSIPISSILI